MTWGGFLGQQKVPKELLKDIYRRASHSLQVCAPKNILGHIAKYPWAFSVKHLRKKSSKKKPRKYSKVLFCCRLAGVLLWGLYYATRISWDFVGYFFEDCMKSPMKSSIFIKPVPINEFLTHYFPLVLTDNGNLACMACYAIYYQFCDTTLYINCKLIKKTLTYVIKYGTSKHHIKEKNTFLYIYGSTLNSVYNEKKYVEILLRYRWLFIKGNVFIGERGIFGAEVFLCYRRFFIKSNFIIGRVECIFFFLKVLCKESSYRKKGNLKCSTKFSQRKDRA